MQGEYVDSTRTTHTSEVELIYIFTFCYVADTFNQNNNFFFFFRKVVSDSPWSNCGVKALFRAPMVTLICEPKHPNLLILICDAFIHLRMVARWGTPAFRKWGHSIRMMQMWLGGLSSAAWSILLCPPEQKIFFLFKFTAKVSNKMVSGVFSFSEIIQKSRCMSNSGLFLA